MRVPDSKDSDNKIFRDFRSLPRFWRITFLVIFIGFIAASTALVYLIMSQFESPVVDQLEIRGKTPSGNTNEQNF
jgi:hypothetical protein